MWERKASAAANQVSPARYPQNVATTDDRHNVRRNRIRMAVIADTRVSSLVPASSEDPMFPVAPKRPTSYNVEPGDELTVTPRRATSLEQNGNAVRVDTTKMGAAQRRLLVRLLELTEDEERRLDERNALTRLVSAFRPRTPVPLTKETRDPAEKGDMVSRWQSPRIAWETEKIAAGYEQPVSPSSLSHALRHLERRGLVLRDVPFGQRGRTHHVKLTTSGRVEASTIRSNPSTAKANLQ